MIADQDGNFTHTFTVPATTPAGPHTVTATGQAGTASTAFTVETTPNNGGSTDGSVAGSGGELAASGGTGSPGLVTLLALIGVLTGTGLAATTRPRPHPIRLDALEPLGARPPFRTPELRR